MATVWRSMHSGNRGAVAAQQTSSSSRLLQGEPAHRCRHEVQFYLDDHFLIRSLSSFVGRALESGASAVVVATRNHCTNLAEELRHDGVDLTSAIEQGRYIALDASDTLSQFMVDSAPDEKRFRACIGEVIACSSRVAPHDAKVAIYGEMVSVLWQRGETKAALRLEELWNQLSADFSFHLLCGYPIASFDRDAYTELFSRICSEHDGIIPAECHPDPQSEPEGTRVLALLQQTEQVLRTEAAERRMAEVRAQEVQQENKELVKELRKHEAVEEELRRFTRRLLTARDEEQRRIASELHENTAQLLAALSVYFGVLNQEKPSLNPRLANAVDTSRSVSDNLLNEIRKLSHLLHPPTLDDLGLCVALPDHIDDFNKARGTRVQLEMSRNLGRFDRNLEITVYRIVEETLADITPRSGSVFTAVRLNRTPSVLMLEIENHQSSPNTEGNSRRETRFMGTHERVMEHGGTMQFTSNPTGSRISIKFPLKDSGSRRN